jgi:hypothetical protein
MKYIATYPLLAACSLTVVNKNEPFIPEYIIPQMLLLWVHNNNRFRGIKYFSCSWMDEARKYNAFNVVLPPKNISDNTHCSQLKAEFKLTKPDFVDVSHLTSADEKAITIMLKPNKREKAEFKFIAE